ncbi:MAG: hypothetical protein V1810_01460 [Candidatus Beckwithbacteria bacterium]
MEPIPPSPIPPTLPPTEPPIISPEALKPKSPQGIFIVLALILIAASVFAFKYYQLKKQAVPGQPSPSSTSLISPQPSPEITDPTADWQLYENSVQNYSFKYPSDWQINTVGASVDINNKLTLSKNNYLIAIYANIQGIGGTAKQVPSVPVTVSGLNLFKRDIGDNLYTNTGSFEISATDSNPTFKYQDKIYEIYLTYPLADKGTENYQANLKTFDLILSTFKFTDWKTYTNTAENFSFQYPLDAQLLIGEDHVEITQGKKNLVCGYDFSFDVIFPKNGVTVNKNFSTYPFNVANREGERYDMLNTIEGCHNQTGIIYLKNIADPQIYDYQIYIIDNTDKQFLSNLILSTFVFTASSATDLQGPTL